MSISNFIFESVVRMFIFFGIAFGLLRWDDNPHPQKIKTRIKFLFKTAKKRKISVAILKTPTHYSNLCLAKRRTKKILFETLPSLSVYKTNPDKIDNKYFLKKFLTSLGYPTPAGKKFFSFWRALAYAKKIDWPVVVKPVSSSLSHGVTINIKNEKELKEAIREAKIFERNFLVEKYILGKSFRVTLVGKKVFASLREPANVIGNGRSQVKELIKKRNQHKLRGPKGRDGWTLRQIEPENAQKFLVRSGLSLDYQPKKGETIKLTDKINLDSGADIFDCTGKIHSENIKKFREIAWVLKAPIIGLDIIMDDISLHWFRQTFFIIEANTVPSIDMHHQPLGGESQDVAGEIWDLLIRKKFL